MQLVEALPEAGRSRVRFLMVPLKFSVDIILSAATSGPGVTQPLTDMSSGVNAACL